MIELVFFINGKMRRLQVPGNKEEALYSLRTDLRGIEREAVNLWNKLNPENPTNSALFVACY